MREPVAIIVGNTEILWSSIIIVIAVAAGFFMMHSLYIASGGKRLRLVFFYPLAVCFSYVIGKCIFYYCHLEQYPAFKSALNFSETGFNMSGVVIGLCLAGLIVCIWDIKKSYLAILDGAAPGTAMVIALLNLVHLYDDGCRGNAVLADAKYHMLPFASPVINTNGETSYRLATFFIGFILFMIAGILLKYFYIKYSDIKGRTFSLFILIFSSLEFILDSTRYDSDYFPFNGFVSVIQIFGGIMILSVSVIFTVRSVRANGFKWYHIILILLILASMGAAGYLEYLIQRHGDKWQTYYLLMSLSCICMICFPFIMCLTTTQPLQLKTKKD